MRDEEVALFRELWLKQNELLEFIGECGLMELYVLREAGAEWVDEAKAVHKFAANGFQTHDVAPGSTQKGEEASGAVGDAEGRK